MPHAGIVYSLVDISLIGRGGVVLKSAVAAYDSVVIRTTKVAIDGEKIAPTDIILKFRQLGRNQRHKLVPQRGEVIITSVESRATGSLIGQQTKLPPNASVENIRSLTRENESAKILWQNGYHVVQNPDYLINREIFDNIAPKTSSVRNVYDRVLEKVNAGQTNSVVINLADSKLTVVDLQKQFNNWPMTGLDKVFVIDQSGNLIIIK